MFTLSTMDSPPNFEDEIRRRTPETVRVSSNPIDTMDSRYSSDGQESDQDVPIVVHRRIIDVGEPVDAISSNKDQTKFVAAGSRGVLKVFKVTDESIEHLIDLRAIKSRRMPLMYSPSNVAWSKLNDGLIATTSTNGAVVLWHLEKGRLDTHYKAHSRSATVVHFHRSNENLLVSGSKDSTIILYDIRNKEPVQTFKSATPDTVRDLSFALHADHHDKFVSADEGGHVKVWDIRKGDRPVRVFQPHHGYVSSIALHPTIPSLVASGGGRDKLIKAWDWLNDDPNSAYPLFQVETIAPVGRVYWRPDHPWQVASCAVVNDMSVSVWDIRRPYLPVIGFSGHRDSVTDVWWNQKHAHRFVSAGKDGLIILHHYSEGEHTLDHLCDTPLDVAPDGLVAVAVNSQMHLKAATEWESHQSMLQLNAPAVRSDPNQMHKTSVHRAAAAAVAIQNRLRQRREYDAFQGSVRSNLSTGIPGTAKKSLQPTVFVALSDEYRLGGAPVGDLCNWNSRVALARGATETAETWRHLQVLLAQLKFQETYNEDAVEAELAEVRKWAVYVREKENQGEWAWLQPKMLPLYPQPVMQRICRHFMRAIVGNEPLEEARTKGDEPPQSMVASRSPRITSEFTNGDFYFGPGELRGNSAGNVKEEPLCDDFFGLPREAFELKPSLSDRRYLELSNMLDFKPDWLPKKDENWDPIAELARTMNYLAEQGDMQMCAVASVVCGHLLLSKAVPTLRVHAWIHSYLDMLDRLEHYVMAARMIKWTSVKRISQISNEGTFHKEEYYHLEFVPDPAALPSKMSVISAPNGHFVTCTGTPKQGRCDECHEPILPTCVICLQLVRGQLWTCVKCSHSMHIEHALEWFNSSGTNHSSSGYCSDEDDDDDDDIEEFEEDPEEFAYYDRKRRIRCPVPWCTCSCNKEYFDENDELIVDAMSSEYARPGYSNLNEKAAGKRVFELETDSSEVPASEMSMEDEEKLSTNTEKENEEEEVEDDENPFMAAGSMVSLSLADSDEATRSILTDSTLIEKAPLVYNAAFSCIALHSQTSEVLEASRRTQQTRRESVLRARCRDLLRRLSANVVPSGKKWPTIDIVLPADKSHLPKDPTELALTLCLSAVVNPLEDCLGPLSRDQTREREIVLSLLDSANPARSRKREHRARVARDLLLKGEEQERFERRYGTDETRRRRDFDSECDYFSDDANTTGSDIAMIPSDSEDTASTQNPFSDTSLEVCAPTPSTEPQVDVPIEKEKFSSWGSRVPNMRLDLAVSSVAHAVHREIFGVEIEDPVEVDPIFVEEQTVPSAAIRLLPLVRPILSGPRVSRPLQSAHSALVETDLVALSLADGGGGGTDTEDADLDTVDDMLDDSSDSDDRDSEDGRLEKEGEREEEGAEKREDMRLSESEEDDEMEEEEEEGSSCSELQQLDETDDYSD